MFEFEDRHKILREAADAGKSLAAIGEMLPRDGGRALSRQRVQQLIRKYGLLARWKEGRKAAIKQKKATTSIDLLEQRPKGRIASNVLRKLIDLGYDVEWGRSIRTTRVQGLPISIHVMKTSYNGRYHTNSTCPNVLRICLFPTGKLLMLMPMIDKYRQTLNFKEEVAQGDDELIAPMQLQQYLHNYRSKLRMGRLGVLARTKP